MKKSDARIFASSKVNVHQDRIDAYLAGERIYPITVELDLTQRCTRACRECPYAASRRQGTTLELPFLERLFLKLGPHTPGIVLSGGEPTFVPHFPQTVALARKHGFKQIAVISNGTRLHLKEVQDALLEHVTSVRVSLYDWQEEDSDDFLGILEEIRSLRARADREGSRLDIGAAMLTRREWNDRILPVGLRALESGIDWLYFHPYCTDWQTGRPAQADQRGVLEAIDVLKRAAPDSANIQTPYERYSEQPLQFGMLHSANFLIQIGADGINYAGPECKYHAEYALLDLNEHLEDGFLWLPQRIERLKKINSGNYQVIGTRHRPPMFSSYIEKVIQARSTQGACQTDAEQEQFLYPDII